MSPKSIDLAFQSRSSADPQRFLPRGGGPAHLLFGAGTDTKRYRGIADAIYRLTPLKQTSAGLEAAPAPAASHATGASPVAS